MEPNDPIQPEETLLRRVPRQQMKSFDPPVPNDEAFDPHRDRDVEGLSVYRRQFHTPQQVADFRTKSKSPVWVAELPASAIFEIGLTVVPQPLEAHGDLPAQRGHALIPELNSASRGTWQLAQRKRLLAQAAEKSTTGPYEAPASRKESAPSAE